jgi:hypothetical protein
LAVCDLSCCADLREHCCSILAQVQAAAVQMSHAAADLELCISASLPQSTKVLPCRQTAHVIVTAQLVLPELLYAKSCSGAVLVNAHTAAVSNYCRT